MSSLARTIIWLVVVAAAVATGFYLRSAARDVSGVTPPETPGRFLFIAGGSDPYWKLCVAGANAAAEDLGAKIEVRLPSGEGEDGLREQQGWLGSVDASLYDGVAVGPIDSERETTLINALAEKAIVVTVDSDAPQSRRMYHIGSSNHEAGMIAARKVKQALPEGGKVAMLLASFAKTNAVERKQGFEEELLEASEDDDESSDAASQADYEIVDFYLDQGDYDRCKENIRKALKEHPDLGIIVCTFGYHGPLALEVLAEVKGGSNVKVLAFDEDERVLDGIESGVVVATIVQDPFLFGSEAIRMLDQARSGRLLSLPIAGRVDVGIHCVAIHQDNLNDFKARLAARSDTLEATEE